VAAYVPDKFRIFQNFCKFFLKHPIDYMGERRTPAKPAPPPVDAFQEQAMLFSGVRLTRETASGTMREIGKVEVTLIAGGMEPDRLMAIENEVGAHAGKLLISLISSSRKI
jgi:hypothetical protein